MFEGVAEATYLIQVLIAFGAGIISFISPCVLPLLPGYLSMMSGYSAAQLEAGEVSSGRMTRVILMFIAGFTVVFAALGAGATVFGTFLRQNMSTFTRISGLVIIAFGAQQHDARLEPLEQFVVEACAPVGGDQLSSVVLGSHGGPRLATPPPWAAALGGIGAGLTLQLRHPKDQ